jgi:RNA polymerase sigma-70 factor (ECF subfamily)
MPVSEPIDQPYASSPEDVRLVAALRRGDESAFASLLELYHSSLVRLAMVYVGNRAVAEEVAQETWLGVIKGIDRFEARSSLKTWIFRILTNTAKTRGEREGRTVPFSSLATETEDGETAVEPERFIEQSAARWGGHWAAPPTSWDTIPERSLASKETRAAIAEAIETLPPVQRQVITLRDVEGWGSDEVCALLDVSEANQRVLLHRARSKVRSALEAYLADEVAAPR